MAKKKDEKNPNSPATTSPTYDRMCPVWAKIDTVLGGTDAMRAAGEVFLPRHEAESDAAFAERLSRNVLLNQLELTRDTMVGRPFSDPVIISEDAPEDFRAHLEDINLQGDNIDVFARDWFSDALTYTFGAVLVEYPRTRVGAGRTLDDDRRENVRPYWVKIPPENIIDGNAVMEGGREILEHVRFRETYTVRERFAKHTRCRIRQLDLIRPGQPADVLNAYVDGDMGSDVMVPGEDTTLMSFRDGRVMVTIWHENLEKKEDDDDRWYVADQYFMEIDEIPLAACYTHRDDLFGGKPRLSDLADLNISHWQSNSDQNIILTVCRFPILAAAGTVDVNKVTIGPHNWLHTQEANGKWYYVEHEGKAIEAGFKHLAMLEDDMAAYGSMFLMKKPGDQTATARALDSAESTSPLQDMVLRFNDAIAQAVAFHAKWMRRKEGIGSVEVGIDFSHEVGNDAHLTEIGKARRDRDLSRNAYIDELIRRKVLPEDFDRDKNDTDLEKEIQDALANMPSIDIDPSGGDPDPGEDPKSTPAADAA